MKRRGFMGLFGSATAAAFVPFVIPESKIARGVLPKWNGTADDGAAAPTAPLVVPAPLKSKRKAFIFGSIYPNLRVQVTEKQAVQFWMGRWWTEEAKQAEVLRAALKHINEHQEYEPVAWELETAQDVERLDKAYTERRKENPRPESILRGPTAEAWDGPDGTATIEFVHPDRDLRGHKKVTYNDLIRIVKGGK